MSIAGKGVALTMAKVLRETTLGARATYDGQQRYAAPKNAVKVKRVAVDGGRALFSFDKRTKQVRIIDRVPHKGSEVAILVTLEEPDGR